MTMKLSGQASLAMDPAQEDSAEPPINKHLSRRQEPVAESKKDGFKIKGKEGASRDKMAVIRQPSAQVEVKEILQNGVSSNVKMMMRRA